MGPENYLEIAVSEWLPRRGEPRVEAALMELARQFEASHQDRWLRDVLAATRPGQLQEGFAHLAAAAKANQSDETEKAVEFGRKASMELGNRNPAAALFAEGELIYALHFQERPVECVSRSTAAIARAAQRHYSWIVAHLQLELGTCQAKLLDAGGGYHSITRAIETARAASYGILHLRGEGILAGVQAFQGNLLGAWERGRYGLATYWRGVFPPLRAQQIYGNLRRASERLDLPHAAKVFARAQVLAVAETSHRRLEALSRVELSALAARTGDSAEAAREDDATQRLFDQLRHSRTAEESRILGEIHRAQSEIALGRFTEASRLLLDLRAKAIGADAVPVQLRFHRAAGEAFYQTGLHRAAEESHLAVLDLTERRMTSFVTPADKAAANEASAKAYRGLAEIHLQRYNDPTEALRIWQRRLDAQKTGPRPPKGREFDLDRLRRETVLSYADLPGGYVVWAFDNRGIAWRRLAPTKDQLEKTALRFVRACADPHSDPASLRRDSRELYQWLVEPLASQLDPGRTLVVDANGAIALVPMQALVDEHSQFLGDRFAITVSSGVNDYLRRSNAPPVTPSSAALVVANPALGRETMRAFPPLLQTLREKESVAARFANTTVLEGPQATLGAIASARPAVELLHFAGHGFGNSGNGGLLLAPQDPALEADILDWRRLAGQDWSRCRLAVLSACSSGTGEARGPVNPESLVRWLLWAGVARVVASRWNADAATSAVLMDEFYSALTGGLDVPAALQLAARRIRGQPSLSHPYYWAGFQTFGAR
ncbi:MAG: CHAT domain-containing protein [Acidobacteria bacterium]|nr:CHAT domain-containing protein [Acidobacteriota bacterium]